MRDDDRLEARLESLLRPFLDDLLLWPVLAVVVGVLATNVAALLVLAFGDRRPLPLVAVFALAVLAARGGVAALRRRRLGPAGGIAVAISALAVIEAILYQVLVAR